ncbi:unnamed protein product [Diatraea saccharalis]|uniref:Uncharacterized protein n=1 Tax=Diatraea saccharalis TaxID=40085 RepID=A0A9N9WEE4_9NEOP|nr:unnamed protein product [Diatraea saccharalis]
MFIILLFLSRADADWVEISQQHYRKPLRTNINFSTLEKVTEVYFQSTRPVYKNETLEEFAWNKGNVNKVSKLGNVQRVQLDSNPVKAPTLRIGSLQKKNNFEETSVVSVNTRYEDYTLDDSNELSAHGTNKSFVMNTNKNETFEVWSTGKNNYPESEIHQRLNKLSTYNRNNSNSSVKGEISVTKKNNIETGPQTGVTDIRQLTNQEFKDKYSKNDSDMKEYSSEYNRTRERSKTKENKKPHTETGAYTHATRDNVVTNKGNIEIEHKSTGTLENNKKNAIENLIKLAKVVTDTIKENTRRTVSSKTRYLENLKESILTNIDNSFLLEERIDSAWPDDCLPRQRRATHATPRGYVQIPSSESALMTISFLTFAVFLIKLVLQVIQTYKTKTMMVAPTIVATVGRATAAAPSRKLGSS